MSSSDRLAAEILHADADSFFASVEQRDDPRLRGRPVAVGGGVVLAASYEAKAYGVRTAMGGRTARRLCPGLIVVPPRHTAYTDASRAMFEVFEDTSPVVEGLSIDEAFIDVRGMRRIAGSPEEIARRLRARVREEVGIAVTVGVARTKFLAKVASGVAKPDGLLVVEPEGELGFLHPLPIARLWGVGAKTAEKLHAHGLTTVAHVAALEERVLVGIVGLALGRQLHALSHNRDPRRVRTGVRRRSIGSQRSLGARGRPFSELDPTLVAIIDRVSRRLRNASRVCRTVVLRLRFADFTRATRSATLSEATSQTAPLLGAARELLAASRELILRKGITLIGISLTNLMDNRAVQLALPLDRHMPTALDRALDSVRDRYGTDAITRAVLLHRDQGFSMPTLPD